MTEQEFWSVVDQTKDVPTDRRLKAFLRALAKLPNNEAIDFLAFFSLFRTLLDRRDIQEVSWLLSGGMGEDSFIDYRDCAVTYGRAPFRRVYLDAQSLLEDDRTLDFTGESFYGGAYDALSNRLGLSDARLSMLISSVAPRIDHRVWRERASPRPIDVLNLRAVRRRYPRVYAELVRRGEA